MGTIGQFGFYLLQYSYYLRFVLLIWAAWAAFLYVSRKNGGMAPFFGGMFELDQRRAAIVSFVGTLLWLSLSAAGGLIIYYGAERFPELAAITPRSREIAAGLVWTALAALPGLWLCGRLRHTWLALGTAAATTLAVGVAIRALVLLPLPSWLDAPDFLRGYLSDDGRSLAPAHAVAALVSVVTVVSYAALGCITGRKIKTDAGSPSSSEREPLVPALAWVLSLLLVAVSTLTALAFFLDRYPFPTLTTAAVVAIALLMAADALALRLTGKHWIESHTFRVFRGTVPAPPRPADLLRGRQKAIVVTAEGGGIHAAAWAARVLETMSTLPGFRESVVATSTVSGGSVGCFYFLASYAKKNRIERGQLFRMASSSSLDHVAWGFGFRDLIRFLVPIGAVTGWGDRAWALQRAWCRFTDWDDVAPDGSKRSYLRGIMLSDWVRLASSGQMPAAIFNTTLVETGQRMSIASVELGNGSQSKTQLHHHLPGFDIRVSTAAALSAAFPYVSPASAPWVSPEEPGEPIPPNCRHHFVDGGYYDNYGVVSAVDFIDNGLRELAAAGEACPEVLVLRIEGTPEVAKDPSAHDGLGFQLLAPVNALLYMRGASQMSRNVTELRLLKDRWGATATISEVCVQFQSQNDNKPPVSWHLTRAEKDALHAVNLSGLKKQVEDFLRGGPGAPNVAAVAEGIAAGALLPRP